MSTRAVLDHFRCPKEFLNFRFARELPTSSGYFQFGPHAICYGRSRVGARWTRAGSCLHDTHSELSFDGSHVVLPFDPDEVIDNFRLERYPDAQMRGWERAFKDMYYWLRPLTNRVLRKFVQNLRAVNWQKQLFPKWPVDTSVENLNESLLHLSIQASGASVIPFIWFWPRGAQGCVAITHDVETSAGLNFCSRLLDINDSFGFKASFQFIPEQRYSVTNDDLDRIRERESEVCVQDLNHDGRLFDDREVFRTRAERINRYGRTWGAIGFRSGLLYRKPEWFGDLEFSYDMSMPNVAHLDPQRGGCCSVMPYFIGDMLELPLTTTQDYSLFHVLNARSIHLWKLQIEMILARHGLASFLVHPDYLDEPRTLEVYRDLLGFLADLRERENIWFALPRDIDRWWRARSRMSIVREGSQWRITGESAERAVLAFARNVNGELVYELSAS